MKRILAIVLLFPAIPLLAHHSFGAEYDANTPITLTGVLTKIEIRMNAKHPDDMIPSYEGDSVVHWEGDPLVVD